MNDNLQSEIGFSGSLNAAISFATGTFWQGHNPETQLTLFSHIFALTCQNFLSGATGIAVLVAFIRGIINNKNGLFWRDGIQKISET